MTDGHFACFRILAIVNNVPRSRQGADGHSRDDLGAAVCEELPRKSPRPFGLDPSVPRRGLESRAERPGVGDRIVHAVQVRPGNEDGRFAGHEPRVPDVVHVAVCAQHGPQAQTLALEGLVDPRRASGPRVDDERGRTGGIGQDVAVGFDERSRVAKKDHTATLATTSRSVTPEPFSGLPPPVAAGTALTTYNVGKRCHAARQRCLSRSLNV